MRSVYIFAAIGTLILLVAFFMGYRPVSSEPSNPCSEPRPAVCTMQYAPACAVLTKGGRKEFSSPCTACSSHAVSGYDTGPCPQ